jgi:hypothetical protein
LQEDQAYDFTIQGPAGFEKRFTGVLDCMTQVAEAAAAGPDVQTLSEPTPATVGTSTDDTNWWSWGRRKRRLGTDPGSSTQVRGRSASRGPPPDLFPGQHGSRDTGALPSEAPVDRLPTVRTPPVGRAMGHRSATPADPSRVRRRCCCSPSPSPCGCPGRPSCPRR